jgi:geranylgeranyl diphosphate synthase type I
LKKFGLNFGMAFQITDDILDIMGDSKKLGKPIGMDIKEGKITIMTIIALKKLKDQEKKSLKKILNNKRKNKNDIDYAIELIKSSGAQDQAQKLAAQYVDKAKIGLKDLSEKNAQEQLSIYADNLIKRKS